jgi:hypothetical protein
MAQTDSLPDQEPGYDEETVNEALAVMHEEYDNTYPEWIRAVADLKRYAASVGIDASDFADGHVHFPVVRWRKYDANALRADANVTEDHIKTVVQWAYLLAGTDGEIDSRYLDC